MRGQQGVSVDLPDGGRNSRVDKGSQDIHVSVEECEAAPLQVVPRIPDAAVVLMAFLEQAGDKQQTRSLNRA
jgi:hypothetical protein